jgi:arginase family enzyme
LSSDSHSGSNRPGGEGQPSLDDITGTFPSARVAVVGVPLGLGSIPPGRCDLGPETLRATLGRLSTYDLETGVDLSGVQVNDAGDVAVARYGPADAFEAIRDAVITQVRKRSLTILAGGNNAITRPGVHGTDPFLKRVGLVTLDAHFDLRDLDAGLNSGNHVTALLADGLSGECIAQIGLAPFVNTGAAHARARDAGIRIYTRRDCRERGIVNVVSSELDRLSRLCDRIYVDFDIDVVDRAELPAAPGARPGGLSADEFFAAARLIGAHPKVVVVDLTEFDPSLDVADVGALTAARWYAEVLAGFTRRH